MRLDGHASPPGPSPAHPSANGASASPGPKARMSRVANGDSSPKPESNGSHTNGTSASGADAAPAAFFGHDREEVTRILIQSLTDLGYTSAADALCKESGCRLEGPTVASFRTAVLDGDWSEAEELLFGKTIYSHGGGIGLDAPTPLGRSWDKSPSSSSASRRAGGLPLSEGANRQEMLFWIKQQKYLELLERRDLGKALMVLRQELTPLRRDTARLHMLSSLIMCKSVDELKAQAQWDGASGTSRHILLSELSKSISPSVMIPEHRLAHLLEEVKQGWIANCLYHNTAASPSLYVEHSCDRNDFPMKPHLELRNHKDEVWFLQYSNDGTRLASASKDTTVVVYDTNNYKPLFHLTEHESGITHLAWSPDDSKLITCSAAQENCAKIWDMKNGRLLNTINDFTYPCTTAAWTTDGKHVIIGSQDVRYGLAIWDLDGNMVHKWVEDNMRVNDIALSPNGERLVVLLEKRIIVYDYLSYEMVNSWTLDKDTKLTSVNISKDSNYMLVSMGDNMIKLMEIDTGDVVESFTGHTQKQFIIRSSFGGADENFVVSGSENSRIYIWRTNGLLVESLDAHPEGCVNAVAWHPKDPKVFASAGDDSKVRIWKPLPLSAQSDPSTSPNGYGR